MPIDETAVDLSVREKELRMLLGRNIKQRRSRLGLSQLELSLAMNISPTFLSDVENGKKWPSPLMLVRIADALHVTAHTFFAPEENGISEIVRALDDCLADVRVVVKQSVEKSIEESLKTIMEYYAKDDAAFCRARDSSGI